MKGLNNIIETISNIIANITGRIIILLMGTMTLVIITNVISRSLFSSSITWSEEMARYSMVWIVFLGSSIALKHGDHVAITYISNSLPNILRKVVTFLMRCTVLFFLYILIVKGFDMAYKTSNQSSSALQISMFWVYLAAPLGGLLMAIQLLLIMSKDLIEKGGES